MPRGIFAFETTADGQVLNSTANVNALRNLWLDRTIISFDDLGPGDEHDFDNGAWHSACHLVAGGGVLRNAAGGLMWVEISHDRAKDEYYSSLTLQHNGSPVTWKLDGPEARAATAGATLLGYVEGNSVGHISARGVSDPPNRFLGWRRQDFDQPADSPEDGGKVWEHWCTVRDIRPSCAIANSVLSAYISLVSALGDRFVAAVARGRTQYGHPQQLTGMVKGGLVSKASAVWDTKPIGIPPAAAALLLDADPAKALQAAAQLDWTAPPRYYMFARRIGSWNPTESVTAALKDV